MLIGEAEGEWLRVERLDRAFAVRIMIRERITIGNKLRTTFTL